MTKKTNDLLSQVYKTEDYFLFKPIDGNRNKNLLHINRLKKSMESNYLFTVIIVNENYEIIDGQHRFEVIKELKLPLYYIVCNGYGLNEVHILNANSKTWNADDYLEGYCKMGYKDYLDYKIFKDKYGFGHVECMTILGGNRSANGSDTKPFYNGEFKINNIHTAYNTADKIELTGSYYPGYRRRSYVYAMLKLLCNDNFEFTEYIQKLKTQPTALCDCTSVDMYVLLIEEIYNYRRREKVNLRFSS